MLNDQYTSSQCYQELQSALEVPFNKLADKAIKDRLTNLLTLKENDLASNNDEAKILLCQHLIAAREYIVSLILTCNLDLLFIFNPINTILSKALDIPLFLLNQFYNPLMNEALFHVRTTSFDPANNTYIQYLTVTQENLAPAYDWLAFHEILPAPIDINRNSEKWFETGIFEHDQFWPLMPVSDFPSNTAPTIRKR